MVTRKALAVLGLAALLSACSSSSSSPGASQLAIAPSAVEASPGDTIHFGATVAGEVNHAVAWTVLEPGGGTIDGTGTYVAPQTEGTYHVQAADSALSMHQVALVSVRRNARVLVTPQTATLAAGASLTLTADVTGTSNDAVTWKVAEGSAGGTVTTAGVYTAPQAAGTYHVVATSVADATKSSAATITVTAPVVPPAVVTVAPQSASVVAGDTVQLTATVTNASNTAVTWSVGEAGGGTVSATGLYTAPATMGTYHVVAKSVADPSQSATVTISVTPTPASGGSGSTTGSTGSTGGSTGSTSGGTTTPPASTGPQFYVATNGNDSNPGTLAQPWRTIQKAMSSATPGSTVNIRAGTYNERLTMNVSGSAGSYITFQPYGFTVPAGDCGGYTGVTCGGEQVVLDYAYLGTNTDQMPLLLISGTSYVRIQGITFQNFTCTGAMQQMVRLDGGASFVEFKYNRILNARNTGGQAGQHTDALAPFRAFSPAHDILAYGNEFGTVQVSDGEVVVAYGSPKMTVEKNWIHDADAIAIDIQQGADNCVVRGNRLEYVAKNRDGSLSYPGAYSAGIYLSGTGNTVVEANSCHYCANAIQVCSEPGLPPTHDSIVRNNVVTNSSLGILIGSWYVNSDDGSVYNITADNNTFSANDVGIQIRPFSPGGVSWMSNIFAGNGTNYVNGGGWNPGTADYNLYSGSGTGPDAHPIVADPQFTNAAAGDFSLAPGSAAVNAGAPTATTSVVGTVDFAGNPRISGGRVDIGAYERQQ